jgi:predicted nucleic acid-binding Zn ribbon protein
MSERRKKPSSIADVLANVLRDAGIADRVEQARLVPEWTSLVGPQIAAVTEPLSISADGTLFVAVTTSAWMTELSLMSPELLRALNGVPGRPPVVRIRLQLKRG